MSADFKDPTVEERLQRGDTENAIDRLYFLLRVELLKNTKLREDMEQQTRDVDALRQRIALSYRGSKEKSWPSIESDIALLAAPVSEEELRALDEMDAKTRLYRMYRLTWIRQQGHDAPSAKHVRVRVPVDVFADGSWYVHGYMDSEMKRGYNPDVSPDGTRRWVAADVMVPTDKEDTHGWIDR